MRRFSANYIYTNISAPLKNGIIEVDDKGKIISIIDTKGSLRESRNLEFYNGVIVPGFVNTHCHLELSGFKDHFHEGSGLPKFLKNIVKYKRENNFLEIDKPIKLYDLLMLQNGIVAVGDISNTNHTLSIKQKSKIKYYSFIEAIGLGNKPDEIFNYYKKIFQDYINEDLNASIVPHAPYSVSQKLFQLIKEFAETNDNIISIHNQESESENQMYFDKSGELFDTLKSLGINVENWEPTGKRFLESIINYLPKNNNIIFVHNTYSTIDDVQIIEENFVNAFWCLCPLSNLFIENKLPDLNIFLPYSHKITLGTDSLASNRVLSILDEMKIIVKNFDDISFDCLVKWATINGAKALKMDDELGSMEIGKKPGLNLISNFDFEKMQITEKSEVKVLC